MLGPSGRCSLVLVADRRGLAGRADLATDTCVFGHLLTPQRDRAPKCRKTRSDSLTVVGYRLHGLRYPLKE